MSSNTSDSANDQWSVRVTESIDADNLEWLKQQATDLINVWVSAVRYIQPAHSRELNEEFRELQGKTLSDGGFFGAVQYLTPDGVTETEKAWFRKAALFFNHVMNSMLGKKRIDDNRVPPQDALEKLDETHGVDALVAFSKLNIIYSQINDVLPPQQVRSAG